MRDVSQQTNEQGEKIFLHLKHIDVLNALRIIRGSNELNMDELMADLSNVQSKYPDACVQVKTGTPTVIFVQTHEML